MFNKNHRVTAVIQWFFRLSQFLLEKEEIIAGPYRWRSIKLYYKGDRRSPDELVMISAIISEENKPDIEINLYPDGHYSGKIMDHPEDPTYLSDVDFNKCVDAMFENGYYVDRSAFDEAITVVEIASIPPNSNPYHHDSIRMGCPIGHHWEAMYYSPQSSEQDPKPCLTELVLINTKTGRRFHLDLTKANELPEIKKNET
jgi:hypothetical protein